MGILSRACGGWLKIPGENFLYALPYALPVLALDINWIAKALFVALALAGGTVGKGQANRVFMDLGTWKGTERKPHNYEKLIGGLKGKISPFQYDFIGLLLVGLAPALIPAIICAAYNPVAGLILACGGLYKAVAYFIGIMLWRMGALKNAPAAFNEGTEAAEFLTGVFAGVSIVSVL
jgi:hypothetical protein